MLQLPSLPSFVFTFLLILLSYIIVRHWIYWKRGPKLPPGPWKLPLIGNLHQLIGGKPHHILRNLAKKHGPIMHLQLGEISTIVISNPAAAEEVLRTHELAFAQRPQLLLVELFSSSGIGTSMGFAPYGDYWRQIRKIFVMKLLSAKRVESYKSLREEEVWCLIDSIISSSSSSSSFSQSESERTRRSVGLTPIGLNLSKRIYSMVNSITFKASSGSKCKDEEEFLWVVRETMALAGGFDLHDVFPSVKLLHVISGKKSALEGLLSRFNKVLNSIVNDRKEQRKAKPNIGNECLLDVLLEIQESDESESPITTDNIKAVISDIFTGGSDTTGATVEWAMTEMIRNPQVMAKAQTQVRQALKGKTKIYDTDVQQLDYLKLIVKETLRLHPVTPFVVRECRESCEINRYNIPIKTKLLVNIWALARDPTHWGADADRFRPERFLNSSNLNFHGTNMEYIPFGAGRRMCPGTLFSMATVELVLAQLLYHFDWELPNGMKPEEVDLNEVSGIILRRKNDLHLIATLKYPFAR